MEMVLVFHIFTALGEFEREPIRERTKTRQCWPNPNSYILLHKSMHNQSCFKSSCLTVNPCCLKALITSVP